MQHRVPRDASTNLKIRETELHLSQRIHHTERIDYLSATHKGKTGETRQSSLYRQEQRGALYVHQRLVAAGALAADQA